MFPITGGLEVAVVLLQVRRLDEALLTEEIESAVHRGKAHAVPALARNLKDFIRTQMPGLLADYLENCFALACKAAAGRAEEPLRVGGCKL